MNWLTTHTNNRPKNNTLRVWHDEIDRLFDDMTSGLGLPSNLRTGMPSAFSPSMDIAETEKAYELTAELPGMTDQNVHVTVEDNVLSISGEKSCEQETKDKNFYRQERSYGKFHRQFTLPADVEADNVEATFKNGLLHVVIPKSTEAASKVKRVEIKN